MKSVSIYALTRKQNLSNLSRLECHLSERDRPLKVRAWEINSMRALVDQLEKYMPEVYRLRLFYSFQILRLGKEFDLLQLLITHRGKVYSREALLETVWKYDYMGDMRTVDVHIRRLREKIERDSAGPEFILTKWGVGYYFTDKD